MTMIDLEAQWYFDTRDRLQKAIENQKPARAINPDSRKRDTAYWLQVYSTNVSSLWQTTRELGE